MSTSIYNQPSSEMDWGMRAICVTNRLPQRIVVAVFAGMLQALSVISCGYHTARTQYRKFETNIPRKRIARGFSPIFTFMCLWAIYILPRSVCLFWCRKIDGPILGIYKLLTDIWMWKLDWGRPIPFLGIHKRDFRCSALSQTIHVFGWPFRSLIYLDNIATMQF